MRIGLAGFAGSGKTTVFNLLTGQRAETGYGGKAKVNLGHCRVPDRRVDFLSDHYQPKKTTFAEIHFADMPGGAPDQSGSGLDAKTAAELRNMDVLALVLRAFDSPALTDPPDPLRDYLAFEAELILADLVPVEKRIERLEKEGGKDRTLEPLRAILAHLETEKPLRTLGLREDQWQDLKGFQFLTLKRLLVLVNTAEDDPTAAFPDLDAKLAEAGTAPLALCATLEAEILELAPDERAEFLADLGVDSSARDRFVQSAYAQLDLISFLTCGEDECRAWTIPRGASAIEAAGKIHTALARGFIRAEVIGWSDFESHGSEQAAKAAGRYRLEGKDYVVQDGDVINVRFNV